MISIQERTANVDKTNFTVVRLSIPFSSRLSDPKYKSPLVHGADGARQLPLRACQPGQFCKLQIKWSLDFAKCKSHTVIYLWLRKKTQKNSLYFLPWRLGRTSFSEKCPSFMRHAQIISRNLRLLRRGVYHFSGTLILRRRDKQTIADSSFRP